MSCYTYCPLIVIAYNESRQLSVQKGEKKSQSQVAANPWHKMEGERETNQHEPNKQTHEKHTDQLSLPQARWSQC